MRDNKLSSNKESKKQQ